MSINSARTKLRDSNKSQNSAKSRDSVKSRDRVTYTALRGAVYMYGATEPGAGGQPGSGDEAEGSGSTFASFQGLEEGEGEGDNDQEQLAGPGVQLQHAEGGVEVTQKNQPDQNPGQNEDAKGINNAMNRCKRAINWYHAVVVTLGWKRPPEECSCSADQMGEGNDQKVSGAGTVVQIFLIVLWSLMLTATFGSQISSCLSRHWIYGGKYDNVTGQTHVKCRHHLISHFLPFIVLLYATYFYGIYLFSRKKTFALENLIKSVYYTGVDAQRENKWRTLAYTMVFLSLGVAWVVAMAVVHVVNTYGEERFNSTLVITWGNGHRIEGNTMKGLVVFSLFGFVLLDVVYMSAIVNYAVQSEMLIDFLRSVFALINMTLLKREDQGAGNPPQDEGVAAVYVGPNDVQRCQCVNNCQCVKRPPNSRMEDRLEEIAKARKFLKMLNGSSANATSLIVFSLACASILALITMNNVIDEDNFGKYFNQRFTIVGTTCSLLMNLVVMIFPFVQAARISHMCARIKETGPRIYVEGSERVSQEDRLTYNEFLQSLKFRATLFGVPIYPWVAYGVITLFTFIVIVVLQTRKMKLWKYL